MSRWKITIEYTGTDYAGWQRQENVPSIQQDIEEAITGFCQQHIRLNAAGRTDSGVHAQGQVAHFDLEYNRDINGHSLAKAINAHLRKRPISIINAEKVNADFHARFSATNKLYTYRIINRPSPPALDQNKVWHFFRCKLDVSSMQQAAKLLIGHHDFTTFRASQCQSRSPEKTLGRLDVEEFEYDEFGGKEILIHAEAKSFLHHQVRNMVGSLVMVGEGKWPVEQMRTSLEAKDRTKGGPTCPADGLYLIRVDYP